MPLRKKQMFNLRLAIAQINSTVGDLNGNSQKILEHIRRARKQKADIIAFPEMAVTGYPPEDLLLNPRFIEDNMTAVKKISSRTEGIAAIIGFVDSDGKKGIFNAAAVVAGGAVKDVYHKMILPNYGVFDEFRYFRPGQRIPVYSMGNIRFGVSICEDIWDRRGPVGILAGAGADVVININASPYERGKPARRERILAEWSHENSIIIAYLNAVGGQDELVFDGFSMVYDQEGKLIARGRQFEEDLMVLDLDIGKVRSSRKKAFRAGQRKKIGTERKVEKISLPALRHEDRKQLTRKATEPMCRSEEEVYRALVLGTADYVRKNGFGGVVIGLSGGIDSSLVATIASDALGRRNVTGILMPSPYTSSESREDSYQLAKNLGISIKEIPIDKIMTWYRAALADVFKGTEADTTEENLQARIRGNILMALSNKFGWLVLTTGNKSEMSVGYATLYGDMAGGFAVIKDVPKTLVYDIVKWRNSVSKKPLVPERVLWKEPTAELKPDQRDSDSLPPYPVLDPILKAYVEDYKSFDEIRNTGCDPECTMKVIDMVNRSEYKRRQAPPGIKITGRAFGRDRRFPITNKYRSY